MWLSRSSPAVGVTAMFVTLCIAVATNGGLAGVLAAEIAEAPSPGVGSWWTYRSTEQVTGTVTENTFILRDYARYDDRPVLLMTVEPVWAGPNKLACTGADTWVIDAQNHTFAACLKDDVELASSPPHEGYFEWPLYLGRAWTAKYHWIDRQRTDQPGRLIQHEFKVLAYEEVAVPAGSFMAFEVNTSSSK